ncbi:MAG: chromosomal replication initiator protein DnaA [Rickettsiales bacterium]|nr:chromosomal replication initiator protein DnaA [Rickettsiales bacterium]
MVENNDPSRWSEARDALRNEFGDSVYNSWLSELSLVSLTDYEIVMSVPTTFVRDWLLREYFGGRYRRENGEHRCLRRGIKEVLLDYFPKLVSFSILACRAEKPKNIETNLASISPHGNLYSLGTELNKNYTFDSYVVGSANRLAFEAAKSFSQGDRLGNPLFIYGGVGLGKTHLCQAIAWAMENIDMGKKIVYLSAEKFMYLFVQALQSQDMNNFKTRFRNIDVLLVDDIQFITGKDKTQREFFYTFDTLVANGKQIVLVCDRAPANLENLDEKLKSRMNGGLLVNIEEYDYSLRLALVKRKSRELGLDLRDDLLEFLAEKLNKNCREIEGCLRRLFLSQSIMGTKFEKNDLENILADNLAGSKSSESLTIETIQKKVAEYFGISFTDLKSKRRQKDLIIPRHMAMYFSRELTSHSLPEIAKKFNGKNHSTIVHGLNNIRKLMETNQEVSVAVGKIANYFKNNGR